jgi:hypothetical protein
MARGEAVKYALAVEVKLVEVPEEPEPLQMPRPGDDPMAGVVALANKAFSIPSQHPLGYSPPAGFNFTKQTTVSVRDFRGLAGIIEKFDNLVHEIEFSGIEQP